MKPSDVDRLAYNLFISEDRKYFMGGVRERMLPQDEEVFNDILCGMQGIAPVRAISGDNGYFAGIPIYSGHGQKILIPTNHAGILYMNEVYLVLKHWACRDGSKEIPVFRLEEYDHSRDTATLVEAESDPDSPLVRAIHDETLRFEKGIIKKILQKPDGTNLLYWINRVSSRIGGLGSDD